jgi:hypothetical protein
MTIVRVLSQGLASGEPEKIDFQNIADERRAAFREKIKARYADLINTIPG